MLSAKIIKTCLIPNAARGIYKFKNFVKNILTKTHPTAESIVAQTALISAIATASTTNIFKMSEPRAPNALKIPISPYLFLILVEIQLKIVTINLQRNRR